MSFAKLGVSAPMARLPSARRTIQVDDFSVAAEDFNAPASVFRSHPHLPEGAFQAQGINHPIFALC
eukprot:365387-Pyramimonas_sp.AAC.1